MLVKKLLVIICLLIFPSFVIQKSELADKEIPTFGISYSSLYEHILESKIKFPDIVLAQAIIESGHFTSDVFNENNNLFGMKIPYVRKTLGIRKNNSRYAYYQDWKQSVDDYKLWQDFVLGDKNITKEEYLHLLKRIYAEDRNYTKKIINIVGKV